MAGRTGSNGPGAVASGAFRVALTFDAEHPDRRTRPGVQERLLEALDREAVTATFFIQGRWAEAYPATAALIPAAGHLVGSHSFYHARMNLLSARGLRADMAAAERAIVAATGVNPRPWFRCPFGAGLRDQRVQAFIREAGYRHVGWHVVANDWRPDWSGAAVEETVVSGVIAHGDGCVVLLHTWPDRTEDAIPGTIRRLRELGAELVPIDRLPRLPETAAPGAADEPEPVGLAFATPATARA